jgi:hypothetical protein
MRFSHLLASIAFLAYCFAPHTAVRADSLVLLSGGVLAPTFQYGEVQGFKLYGNTNGKKCTFTYAISLNGGPAQTRGPISAALPWTSDDFKLPASNGASYALAVNAVDLPGGANACTGQLALSFVVVPQIGKLSAITTSASIVAVNQTIGFTVSGQSFGYCNYNSALNQTGSQIVHSLIKQVPYQYSAALPAPGEYFATADEIDDQGTPEGCTGHVKTVFTVIPRPPCPSVLFSYQTSNDSEFGCSYVPIPNTSIPAFTCPTGYNKFQSSLPQIVWYGCRQQSSAALTLETVGGLLGGLQKSTAVVGLGSGGGTVADITATPTIVSLQAVAAPAGGAWRPNSNVLYAGDVFQFDVAGNVPNSGGYLPNLCAYSVEIRNSKGQLTNQAGFTEFKIWDAGAVAAPGVYSVRAIPYTPPGGGGTPPCLGKAEIKVRFYPKAAWITGLKLVGFGYHFAAGDAAGMPQFCPNCDSIFSPAHDRAFLQIIPIANGSTPGGSCAYGITATGTDANEIGGYGTIDNGQPAVPVAQQQFFSPTLGAPYWQKLDGTSITAAVTILAVTNFPPYPPCNVIGGTITKTITFTNNPAQKVVE